MTNCLNNTNEAELQIPWSKVAEDCKKLAHKLSTLKIDGIIAVARGGMIPASLIGRLLDIHKFEVLVLSSYDNRKKGDISIIRQPEAKEGNWVLVDELADSGSTVVKLRELYPNYPIAVLYVKTAGRDKPDFYIEEYANKTWLTFPWEVLKE